MLIDRQVFSSYRMRDFRSLRPAIFLAFALLSMADSRGFGQGEQGLPGLAKAVHAEVKDGSAKLLHPLDPDTVIHFGILLQPRDKTALTARLDAIGNRSDPQFRHFLNPDEFGQQFGPSVDNYEAVLAIAEAGGFKVTKTFKSHLLVDLSGTVPQLEKAFHIKMNVYQHPTESRTFFSADREPAIALPFSVLSVAGLDDFATAVPAVAKTKGRSAIPAVGSAPGGDYFPSDIRAAYYGGTALTGSGQIVGLIQFDGFNIDDVTSDLGNGATSSDLGSGLYSISYSTEGMTFHPTVRTELIDGASSSPSTTIYNNGPLESALDVAQAIGLAPGLSEVIQYIGTSASNDYDLFEQMADENLAKQIGVSWGWTPSDDSRLDAIFQQMAAQGQNIFVATGDEGSWPYSGGYYFPAEDPNVTAVGGTNLSTSGPAGAYIAESGWIGSSGGYSPDQYAIPSYQSSLAGTNGASSTYRNAPDVSIEASSDYACSFGVCEGEQGTSFAAPRWAGFMALANQEANAANNTSIGFINPILYSIRDSANYSTTFHDVTSGSNGSFLAGSNYDLVTGVGSPYGQALLDALQVGSSPKPWVARISPLTNNGCTGNETFNFTVTQQTNANSLSWNASMSVNDIEFNQGTWLLEDSSGTFVSGSLSGFYSSSTTINTSALANRAPVGTPTLFINGQAINTLTGCDASFGATVIATH